MPKIDSDINGKTFAFLSPSTKPTSTNSIGFISYGIIHPIEIDLNRDRSIKVSPITSKYELFFPGIVWNRNRKNPISDCFSFLF